MAMQEKGEGESNHVRFFELFFQEDMCIPRTCMKKQHKSRITHTRPAGEEVQLDHVITPVQWQNIIIDVSTVSGAALNSNQYLVKVRTTLRTKRERREKPKPKKTRRPTEEYKELYNILQQTGGQQAQSTANSLPTDSGGRKSKQIPAAAAHSPGRSQIPLTPTTPQPQPHPHNST